MRFSQLRNLLALTTHSSLGSAAQALGIAQPVLTRSIQALELELGVKLIERSARGTSLTPEGERLAVRASRVERELQMAREELAQWRGQRHGCLSIGVSPVVHLLRLPRAIALFRKEYPGIRVNVSEGLFSQVFSSCDSGKLDFAVGPLALAGGPVPATYVAEHLFTSETAVFARKGHPLAGSRSLLGLLGADWVSGDPCEGPGDVICRTFTAQGLPPPVPVMHCDSAVSALEFVAETDLLAMLPRRLIEVGRLRDALRLVPVQEPIAAAAVCLVYRRDAIPTPAARALMAAIRLCAKTV